MPGAGVAKPRPAASAGLLVAAKRDRIARDVVVAATVEQMAFEAGAKVITADGVAVEDTPEGQLLRGMLDRACEAGSLPPKRKGSRDAGAVPAQQEAARGSFRYYVTGQGRPWTSSRPDASRPRGFSEE